MFEPEPGVRCNVDKMFRCYAENYLSDFPQFKWGGYIVMDAKDYKHSNSAANEPVYQFLATGVDDMLLNQVFEYIQRNPMHGYYSHIYVGRPNENEKMVTQ